jgi:hypothetical protein
LLQRSQAQQLIHEVIGHSISRFRKLRWQRADHKFEYRRTKLWGQFFFSETFYLLEVQPTEKLSVELFF